MQNVLIRTQQFRYLPYFETEVASLFQELKSLMTVWCCKTSRFQIRYCRTGEEIKTNF